MKRSGFLKQMKKKSSGFLNQMKKARAFREREITLTPFFVELDDLVDDLDALETTALRFADDFGVVTLLFSKQIDVQHFLYLCLLHRVCDYLWMQIGTEKSWELQKNNASKE